MNEITVHELYSAIRQYCLECSGGSIKCANGCKIKNCKLYPYRMGDATKREKKRSNIKGQIRFADLLKEG